MTDHQFDAMQQEFKKRFGHASNAETMTNWATWCQAWQAAWNTRAPSPLVQELVGALEQVYSAFDKGTYDKFGRLRLTKAQGEQLWGGVASALARARGE